MVNITLVDRSKLILTLARKGKSLNDFAKATGISSPYLSQILNGKRTPSAKTAYKIAKELDLDIEDIFSIEVNDNQRKVI